MCRSLVLIARRALGRPYLRTALTDNAPDFYNCLSLICWALRQVGIEVLPRFRCLSTVGEHVADLGDLSGGEILFTSGQRNWYRGMGHVGLATGTGTVIHACYKQRQVVEVSLSKFMQGRELRCARRISQEVALINLGTNDE